MKCGSLGRAFWAVLALYVAGALTYSFVLPLGEAPDEPGHYNYARIVSAEQRRPGGHEEHEAFQPPLYYWLAAPAAGLGDVSILPLKGNADFDLVNGPGNLLVHSADEVFPYAGWATGWHLVRLLSVALGAVTVYAVYRVGYLVGRGSGTVAAVGAALLALAPQFVLLHGAASNDVLALALGALVLLQAVLLAQGRATRRRLLAVGLTWGLATLAKSSMLAGGAALGIGLLIAHRRSRPLVALFEAIRDFAVAAAPAALVCGWWFVDNVVRYGDPMAWELIYAINAARTSPVNWLDQAWGLHRSYWLGYVAMGLPPWLYAVLVAPVVLGVIGVLRRARWGRPLWNQCLAFLAGVQAVTFVVAWMRWTVAVQGTDQARLIYGGLVALVPLVAAGIVAALGERRALTITLTAAVALNACALIFGVLPVYRSARQVALPEVPSGGPPVAFAGSVHLLSWRLPEVAVAGEALAVDTWWSTDSPIAQDLWLTLRLTAADGAVPVWKRGTPTAGRDTTDRWIPGVVVLGEHRLRLPADLSPGTYTVEVGLQEFDGSVWWPASSAGSAASDVWALGTVAVVASAG